MTKDFTTLQCLIPITFLFTYLMSGFLCHFLSTILISLSASYCSQSLPTLKFILFSFPPSLSYLCVCLSRWEFGKCSVSRMKDKCCFTSPAPFLIRYERKCEITPRHTRAQTLTLIASVLPYIRRSRLEEWSTAAAQRDRKRRESAGQKLVQSLERTQISLVPLKRSKGCVFVCQR